MKEKLDTKKHFFKDDYIHKSIVERDYILRTKVKEIVYKIGKENRQDYIPKSKLLTVGEIEVIILRHCLDIEKQFGNMDNVNKLAQAIHKAQEDKAK
jgi:hypothetical protein